MKIEFLGAGRMAIGMGKRLAHKGHEIFFSFSRSEASLIEQAHNVGVQVLTCSPAQAAEWADVVILATPYQVAPAALAAAGNLAHKIVRCITNTLKTDSSGLEIGTTTSGAEALRQLAPKSRFVAALPPFAEVLQASKLLELPPSVFVCTDDDGVRNVVSNLLRDIDADPANGGALFAARYFEPALMGLVYLAYGIGMEGKIGLHFLRTDYD